MASTSRRWPYRGPCWSGGGGTYYVTPEVLESLHVAEGVMLCAHPDGEFIAGFLAYKERCWFYPCPTKLPHGDYERAGLTYTIDLPENSDGGVLFELLKLVGAEYASVGMTPAKKRRK